MIVTFWGTRGSIAKPGPTTLRHGGNTSCVELRSEAGTLIILDCGTGAHDLGQHLMARADGSPIEGNILISHTHWDHIQGLPFFAPLFTPGNQWRVYGPRGLGSSLSETLAGQMEYSYFPVTLDQLQSSVDYHDLVEGRLDIDEVQITTQYLNHPALALGYRLEVDGAVLVYASDHEPHQHELAAGGDVAHSAKDLHHADFFRDADLLIHDAQYLAEEYPSRIGWGHSTVEYVVDVAHQAGVRNVALFHHDPTRVDDAVDELVARARSHAAAAGYDGNVFAAAEGMTLELRGDGSDNHSRHRSPATSATQKPALDGMRSSIVIAASDQEVAAVLRKAALAEGLEIHEASDLAGAVILVGSQRPSLVLLADGLHSDVFTSINDIVAVPVPFGEQAAIVVVSGLGSRHPAAMHPAVTDTLVWPSSVGYVRTRLHAWLLRRACRWQNAPLPANETARLESLRALAVLDTAPEERFDRITQTASSSLDVPIALVSLIDGHRQWFKSRVGLAVSETPRDLAFCAHAILGDDVLQVPDALADSRFADNPLVIADPHLRFYAGAPLTLSDGTRAGTLCVIDYRPRLLDDDQLDELRRLAAQVAAELERH